MRALQKAELNFLQVKKARELATLEEFSRASLKKLFFPFKKNFYWRVGYRGGGRGRRHKSGAWD